MSSKIGIFAAIDKHWGFQHSPNPNNYPKCQRPKQNRKTRITWTVKDWQKFQPTTAIKWGSGSSGDVTSGLRYRPADELNFRQNGPTKNRGWHLSTDGYAGNMPRREIKIKESNGNATAMTSAGRHFKGMKMFRRRQINVTVSLQLTGSSLGSATSGRI